MIIEYIKDCKDERNNRQKQIKKGTKLNVTKEFGEKEIAAKKAVNISHKQEEFLKEIFKKNTEEDGNN